MNYANATVNDYLGHAYQTKAKYSKVAMEKTLLDSTVSQLQLLLYIHKWSNLLLKIIYLFTIKMATLYIRRV